MAGKTSAQATMPDGVVGTADLSIDGGSVSVPLSRRTFSTGSEGFSAAVKVVGTDGRRYQVSLNAVLIGSKPSA